MLQDLVDRVRVVGDHLDVEVPPFSADRSEDDAGYAFFFLEFLSKLEETVKSLDERLVEESRALLVIATTRIFANLTRLHPSMDLKAVTGPVELSTRTPVAQEAAEAYAAKFEQVEVDEGEGDGGEDAADESEA